MRFEHHVHFIKSKLGQKNTPEHANVMQDLNIIARCEYVI